MGTIPPGEPCDVSRVAVAERPLQMARALPLRRRRGAAEAVKSPETHGLSQGLSTRMGL